MENLNWIQLISAIGIGALVTKILDIVWLQKALHANEKKKWLREKRLKAYTEITKEILTLGENLETRESHFKGYSLAAESVLLVEDEALAFEIEAFFTKAANLYNECITPMGVPGRKSEEELTVAYEYLVKESREIVVKLRRSLLK